MEAALGRARGTAGRLAAKLDAHELTATPGPTIQDFSRTLGPQALARESDPVTAVLWSRLSESDILATEQLIRESPGTWEHYFGDAERAHNRDLTLALGMWLGSELLSERTGLIRAEPPDDVHAMTRGAQNAAGGLYEANMVVAALEGAGADLSAIRDGLDFGCSSGRVVKPLAAAYPQARWRGCDPNGPAVAWARQNLPGIEFFASENLPPLALANGELDLVYAISIWSHFKPSRGELWFAEMRRLLAPGGYLVITTHGPTSVAHYAAGGMRSPAQSQEILEQLYKQGWWYRAEFGAAGDWGVVDPEWGTAFVTPEWVLAQLCPQWRVLEYAPGRNQNNQDVYVLQRV